MSNNENEPVFQYTLHKKLWNILVDNPGMSKHEALNEFFTIEEIKEFGSSSCTACEYVNIFRTDDIDYCDPCPLDVREIQKDPLMDMAINCLKGLYGVWNTATMLLYQSGNICQYLTPEEVFMTKYLGDDYSEEKLKELCSKYAKAIADLPVKAGVKYI